MTRRPLIALVTTAAVALAVAASGPAVWAAPSKLEVHEFSLPAGTLDELRERWLRRVRARYGTRAWAPMGVKLTNSDLALMGLPRKEVLFARRYEEPTIFGLGGRLSTVDPKVISVAGTGFFGIRPGAWLLIVDPDKGEVGWCSMAHVYGSPGEYSISTAGHCGKANDRAMVIGLVGDRYPVLLEFGRFGQSHDNGLGKDWALIRIHGDYQHLVTPTMAFWGGPIGMYASEGAVASARLFRGNWLDPQVEVNPAPALAQSIVHYGHGLGVGAGGTPRAGTAIHWGRSHFMFSGAINFGDSGSGANTLLGDAPGDQREAAGIMTHIWIDPLMRDGIGIMGGTRATQVSATLADGQLLPYPAPVPGAP